MGINYYEGIIDSEPQPVIPHPRFIKNMDDVDEGYFTREAFWFDQKTTVPMIDAAEICYTSGQISEWAEEYCEEWLRVIRVPLGFIVDFTHNADEFWDEDGKLVIPLPLGPSREPKEPVQAFGPIRTDMQLEAVATMIRENFGFVLPLNILALEDAEDELKNSLQGDEWPDEDEG